MIYKTLMRIIGIIKKIPFIKMVYKKYSVQNNNVSFWISKCLDNNDLILQIGSNDGKTGDPIFELIVSNTNWRAIFIEPVPYLFKKLKENYGEHKRFKFFNIAINDGSTQDFFFVDENINKYIKDLPPYWNQLGSFNREHIVKHLDGILEPYIVFKNLECITLTEFLRNNNIQYLGLLHIDAEGSDWQILSQLNLKEIRPKIILIEHKHLKEIEIQNLFAKLHYNYQIFLFGQDLLCISKYLTKFKALSFFFLMNRKVNNLSAIR